MAIELITGRAGAPHVDSADVGAFNAVMFGAGAYVLDGIGAELVDANNVTVSAGEMLCEGRHIRITGAGETLTIDNGTSAYKRHDIIAAHYLRDEDGMESVALVVVKGTPSIDTPTDPAMPTTGKLIDGASEVYWPLYRVVIDGLTPQAPVFIAERQALYTLGIGTKIPDGANLNGYTTPGIYYVNDFTAASASNNRPSYVPGRLIVYYPRGNSSFVSQMYIVLYPEEQDAGVEFLRTTNDGGATWGAWTCIGGVDSITKEGETTVLGIPWRWIKLANGDAFAFTRFWPTFGGHSNTWNNMHLYGVGVAFPFEFRERPKVFHSLIAGSSASLPAGINESQIGNTYADIYCWSSQTDLRSGYAEVAVIGRWK